MYQKHILIFNRLSTIYEKLGDEIRATAYHNLSKKLELDDTETVSEKSWKKINFSVTSQKKNTTYLNPYRNGLIKQPPAFIF